MSCDYFICSSAVSVMIFITYNRQESFNQEAKEAQYNTKQYNNNDIK